MISVKFEANDTAHTLPLGWLMLFMGTDPLRDLLRHRIHAVPGRLVPGKGIYGNGKKITPHGPGCCRRQHHRSKQRPGLPFLYGSFRRHSMDISVVATIGFTTAAVIGIIVLVFTGTRKEEQHHKITE